MGSPLNNVYWVNERAIIESASYYNELPLTRCLYYSNEHSQPALRLPFYYRSVGLFLMRVLSSINGDSVQTSINLSLGQQHNYRQFMNFR